MTSVNLLRDLVRLPSVNPMGRSWPNDGILYEHRVTDYLEDFYRKLDVSYERQPVAAKRENIIARYHSPGATKTFLFEVHQDTVPVEAMIVDPFGGEIRDGKLYGRGACDVKGSMAVMLSVFERLVKEKPKGAANLILACTVDEEHTFLGVQELVKTVKADFAIVAEPTMLRIVDTHKGVVRWKVHTTGRACHSSRPERGVNAVYRMAPIIAEIEWLNDSLTATADPFLGKGSCTISAIRSTSPSLCAVADSATIHVDRRLTHGETWEGAVKQIEALESVRNAGATVSVLDYAVPSYTGLTYPTKKYYPTWLYPEDHPAVLAGVHAAESALGRKPVVGKWGFSTNGIATAGMFGVPTIGFGPSDEIWAHSPDDQCPVNDLTLAARFYAAFPQAFVEATR